MENKIFNKGIPDFVDENLIKVQIKSHLVIPFGFKNNVDMLGVF